MNQLCNSYQIVNDTMTWIVAIYVRLSREDEKDDKYKGQSESIENQIKFLKSIVNKMGWILFDVYIDDGYTGTNFNRPAFQRMIADVEKKNINLIITKDLSRLGRDYIETGRYLEKYFPKKRVRYIAVNDNIDTYYKGQNVFRVGAEFRVTPKFSVRAGYNYQTSNVNDGAQDGSDYVYTSGTDPSYTFDNKTQYITCGLGFRTGGFYIDAAYVHKDRESEFHAFSRYGLEPGERYKLPSNAPNAPTATIKDNNNSIVLSVGYKF